MESNKLAASTGLCPRPPRPVSLGETGYGQPDSRNPEKFRSPNNGGQSKGRHRHQATTMKQARWPPAFGARSRHCQTQELPELRPLSIPELSLFSKLDGVTVPEFGQGATVGDDPKACQGTKDNLCDEVSSDSPHSWMERRRQFER
ncbi:hypothetical protein Acr_24g0010230 [Actinidia rufa]|uniref:Uncharacterized protein n=1 Tax=Actinidia rufa TaxID=165716 RepID=A0A7J0GVK7_9ERIC|nr:hypothetical protein Acr_24g0010230 [Actinidia rufa]